MEALLDPAVERRVQSPLVRDLGPAADPGGLGGISGQPVPAGTGTRYLGDLQMSTLYDGCHGRATRHPGAVAGQGQSDPTT